MFSQLHVQKHREKAHMTEIKMDISELFLVGGRKIHDTLFKNIKMGRVDMHQKYPS